MGDLQRPGPETDSGLGSSAPERGTPGFQQPMQLPRGVELKDPLSVEVHFWLGDLQKAVKALRVYAENNEMLHKQVDRAFFGLTRLLEKVPELTLAVREDRLLFEKDPVHVNPDREEGIPFIFYRSAFRRLTFVRGMERDELVALMRAIATDHAAGFDYAGQDLVTALWRLALPHLRYLTIDALSLEGSRVARREGEPPEARSDVERIQADIDGIVASIYRSNTSDDDLVAGVSISREDLEALKEVRLEDPEDLDLLDLATARAIADVPEAELAEVRASLASTGRDDLVRRILEILIDIVFKERSSRDAAGTIELLLQLFDSLVLGQRYADATELVLRLRATAEKEEDLQEMHVAQHLLRLFAGETRVLPVLTALNDQTVGTSVTEVTQFLRILGATIAPTLLGGLDNMTAPAHRRLMVDLIIEFGVPSAAVLQERAQGAKWFVVRDLLQLAQELPPERVAPLVAFALTHEHPKVREQAVGMLRDYAPGLADRYLADRLNDDDLEVRLAAVKVAAARRSVEAKNTFEQILQGESLQSREPREVRLVMAAYAAIAGQDAIPLLDRILNPGLLGILKGAEAQVAAAFALASLGPEAVPALQRGARTLNVKVRDACRRALSRDGNAAAAGSSREDVRGLAAIPASGSSPLNARRPRADGSRNDTSEASDLRGRHPRGEGSEGEGREGGGDLDFVIGSPTLDARDRNERAPAFDPQAVLPPEPAAPLHPEMRQRPSMARVERPYAVPDELAGAVPRPELERAADLVLAPPEPAKRVLEVPRAVTPAPAPSEPGPAAAASAPRAHHPLAPDYQRALGREYVPASAPQPPSDARPFAEAAEPPPRAPSEPPAPSPASQSPFSSAGMAKEPFPPGLVGPGAASRPPNASVRRSGVHDAVPAEALRPSQPPSLVDVPAEIRETGVRFEDEDPLGLRESAGSRRQRSVGYSVVQRPRQPRLATGAAPLEPADFDRFQAPVAPAAAPPRDAGMTDELVILEPEDDGLDASNPRAPSPAAPGPSFAPLSDPVPLARSGRGVWGAVTSSWGAAPPAPVQPPSTGPVPIDDLLLDVMHGPGRAERDLEQELERGGLDGLQVSLRGKDGPPR
jgi:hypothetical protein